MSRVSVDKINEKYRKIAISAKLQLKSLKENLETDDIKISRPQRLEISSAFCSRRFTTPAPTVPRPAIEIFKGSLNFLLPASEILQLIWNSQT